MLNWELLYEIWSGIAMLKIEIWVWLQLVNAFGHWLKLRILIEMELI